MNERIKELRKQAIEFANATERDTDHDKWDAACDAKFAELILTDVFQHLTDTGHDYCREILEKRYDMVDPRFAEYLKEQYERTN